MVPLRPLLATLMLIAWTQPQMQINLPRLFVINWEENGPKSQFKLALNALIIKRKCDCSWIKVFKSKKDQAQR